MGEIVSDLLRRSATAWPGQRPTWNRTTATDDLAAAGMWPSVPTEDWSDNTGVYLLFRSNRDGTYKGPSGKREICAGKDPDAIAEARRLAENRRRWEACELAAWNLDKWITGKS